MKKTDCIVLRSERLRDKTGLSIRRIVSEIIVQAEPLIRIEPAEEE